MNQKVGTAVLAVAAVMVMLVFLLLPSPPSGPDTARNKDDSKQPAQAPQSYAVESGASASATPGQPAPVAPPTPSGANWEERLDQLLTTEADNSTTVRGLVSSMRGLPAEAQEEFVAHAANLCEDEQFGVLAEVYYGRDTPRQVSEIIFNDALNRPDEIKLPLLAKTLRNPSHPMAVEAREILEMYLNLEPGAAPATGWEQAVNDYIRQQVAP